MKTIQELRRDLQAQLDPFFYPDSIAIIGASQNMIKPSGIPLNLLTLFDYAGEIYPINPKYGQLGGRKCYPSIVEVPRPVDLAIIGVPAAVTLESLHQCAAKGVKAAIIFTSGFAEVGEDGRVLQEEISRLARDSGMRILGPNCLGVVNFYNGSAASFMFHDKPKDLYYPETLFLYYSERRLGAIIFQMVLQHSVGCNYFVSTGNEADVNFAEALSYLVGRTRSSSSAAISRGLPQGGRSSWKHAMRRSNSGSWSLSEGGPHRRWSYRGGFPYRALVGEDRVYDGGLQTVRRSARRRCGADERADHPACRGRLPAGKILA